jgi:hypothetical protein
MLKVYVLHLLCLRVFVMIRSSQSFNLSADVMWKLGGWPAAAGGGGNSGQRFAANMASYPARSVAGSVIWQLTLCIKMSM